jgi:peptide/nickel transport system permease protein
MRTTLLRERLDFLNPALVTGALIILVVLAFSFGGRLFYDMDTAYIASVPIDIPPVWKAGGSWEHPLGSDSQGRDILASILMGIPLSLQIGFTASLIGLAVGSCLGAAAAYTGGWLDNLIRTTTDVFITIPSLAVLIVVSSFAPTMTVTLMALMMSVFSWPGSARVFRALVFSMKERGYVKMAMLSGLGPFRIMLTEILPNLMPLFASSLSMGITGAILAEAGLETLGLGPTRVTTLGMMIFYANNSTALVKGMWWWLMSPIFLIVLLFLGFYLITIGLDQVANPRLKRRKEPRR